MRILLFLGANIAVMFVLGLVFSLFGFEGLLKQNGVDLDLQALLVYSAVIGFGGSLISLFLSKTMAKHSMGVHVIEQATSRDE
ncbi:MAG: protease HtpX, partial [Chromatiales bacterium]